MLVEEVEISCPYCGGQFVTLVDCSGGSEKFIEDCQVCCAPINFHTQIDEKLELLACWTTRDDE